MSHGALASVHFSCNGVTGDQKVKVLIDSSRRAAPSDVDMGSCIRAALVVVEDASAQAVVTDRGHKHTNRKIEACFWIRRKTVPGVVKEVEKVGIDCIAGSPSTGDSSAYSRCRSSTLPDERSAFLAGSPSMGDSSASMHQ